MNNTNESKVAALASRCAQNLKAKGCTAALQDPKAKRDRIALLRRKKIIPESTSFEKFLIGSLFEARASKAKVDKPPDEKRDKKMEKVATHYQSVLDDPSSSKEHRQEAQNYFDRGEDWRETRYLKSRSVKEGRSEFKHGKGGMSKDDPRQEKHQKHLAARKQGIKRDWDQRSGVGDPSVTSLAGETLRKWMHHETETLPSSERTIRRFKQKYRRFPKVYKWQK